MLARRLVVATGRRHAPSLRLLSAARVDGQTLAQPDERGQPAALVQQRLLQAAALTRHQLRRLSGPQKAAIAALAATATDYEPLRASVLLRFVSDAVAPAEAGALGVPDAAQLALAFERLVPYTVDGAVTSALCDTLSRGDLSPLPADTLRDLASIASRLEPANAAQLREAIDREAKRRTAAASTPAAADATRQVPPPPAKEPVAAAAATSIATVPSNAPSLDFAPAAGGTPAEPTREPPAPAARRRPPIQRASADTLPQPTVATTEELAQLLHRVAAGSGAGGAAAVTLQQAVRACQAGEAALAQLAAVLGVDSARRRQQGSAQPLQQHPETLARLTAALDRCNTPQLLAALHVAATNSQFAPALPALVAAAGQALATRAAPLEQLVEAVRIADGAGYLHLLHLPGAFWAALRDALSSTPAAAVAAALSPPTRVRLAYALYRTGARTLDATAPPSADRSAVADDEGEGQPSPTTKRRQYGSAANRAAARALVTALSPQDIAGLSAPSAPADRRWYAEARALAQLAALLHDMRLLLAAAPARDGESLVSPPWTGAPQLRALARAAASAARDKAYAPLHVLWDVALQVATAGCLESSTQALARRSGDGCRAPSPSASAVAAAAAAADGELDGALTALLSAIADRTAAEVGAMATPTLRSVLARYGAYRLARDSGDNVDADGGEEHETDGLTGGSGRTGDATASAAGSAWVFAKVPPHVVAALAAQQWARDRRALYKAAAQAPTADAEYWPAHAAVWARLAVARPPLPFASPSGGSGSGSGALALLPPSPPVAALTAYAAAMAARLPRVDMHHSRLRLLAEAARHATVAATVAGGGVDAVAAVSHVATAAGHLQRVLAAALRAKAAPLARDADAAVQASQRAAAALLEQAEAAAAGGWQHGVHSPADADAASATVSSSYATYLSNLDGCATLALIAQDVVVTLRAATVAASVHGDGGAGTAHAAPTVAALADGCVLLWRLLAQRVAAARAHGAAFGRALAAEAQRRAAAHATAGASPHPAAVRAAPDATASNTTQQRRAMEANLAAALAVWEELLAAGGGDDGDALAAARRQSSRWVSALRQRRQRPRRPADASAPPSPPPATPKE